MPQLVAADAGVVHVGGGEELVDVGPLIETPLTAGLGVDQVAHQGQEIAAHVLEGRHGEITLGPVDDAVRQQAAGQGLEGILATLAQPDRRRAAGGQHDQLVVEERHPRLQAPGHGHVVHPLDRVVDDQGAHIQAQHGVDQLRGPGAVEQVGNQQAGVVRPGMDRGDQAQVLSVIAVEIVAAEGFLPSGPVEGLRRGQLRIPEITAEDLVRPLAGLDHLDLPGHRLAQEIEGDGVLAEHGLGHGVHRLRQAAQDLAVGDVELVVAGAIARHHLVGVLELAAGLLRGVLEAHREGMELAVAQFRQQGYQQAGVQAPGEQHPHWHVRHLLALAHRVPQGGAGGLHPVAGAQAVVRADAGQAPILVLGGGAVGLEA